MTMTKTTNLRHKESMNIIEIRQQVFERLMAMNDVRALLVLSRFFLEKPNGD